MPTTFWITTKTHLTARTAISFGPPFFSMRASADRPTVVKNIRSRLSLSAMLKETFTPKNPSATARRIAPSTPPPTGAGMLNRLSTPTRATSSCPAASTTNAARMVNSRSSWTLLTRLLACSAPCAGRQRRRLEQLQPMRGVIAVDFLHVQLAHERDRVGPDDLSWHHAREPRRGGPPEGGRAPAGRV